MNFGLLVFTFLAVPIWLVRKGRNPVQVGEAMLGICVFVILVGMWVNKPWMAFPVLVALSLAIVSAAWLVVAAIRSLFHPKV